MGTKPVLRYYHKENDMELNIDLIDYDLGEVRMEGVTREAAQSFIEKFSGEIKEEISETVDLDDIDGGGTMEVVSIYARFPESVKDLRGHVAGMARAAEFWLRDPEVIGFWKGEVARLEDSLED
jgi:hypothetical protein